jgi:maltooligosyltrehalose trehalohydrolase
MIFMGEEWGSTRPFNYFVSHSDELGDAIRKGRIEEFALAAGPDNDGDNVIPDPCDCGTYQASIPDQLDEEDCSCCGWITFYKRALQIRRENIQSRLPGVGVDAYALGSCAVLASWRLRDGATLTVLSNQGTNEVKRPTTCPFDSPSVIFESRGGAHVSLRHGCFFPIAQPSHSSGYKRAVDGTAAWHSRSTGVSPPASPQSHVGSVWLVREPR